MPKKEIILHTYGHVKSGNIFLYGTKIIKTLQKCIIEIETHLKIGTLNANSLHIQQRKILCSRALALI